ncbi:Uncharacterized membrane protein YhaH, DUF805 family [Plantibacter flavus]|uniref:Uncharacterized membrane protein YhaH (DUF805 family) n=1 Tax=Plantibacter flavus TaxID=150123 RepID=A0A3N2C533_9MICO|nr:DUF805 domain-containing protein [Plantibacter flavus]ROR82602.1 uncharacterized membrane protein YhaH (DUF805 family) [Plantibacter flavus]SMG38885.1 Uncharacterized membrane protein YhaH, DUF805 family [Plantibacter flavus]
MSSNTTPEYPATPTYGQPYAPAPIRGAASPEDLTLPLYGATFPQAVKRYLRKYTTFTGRASRSEYWWVTLFIFLVTLIPNILFFTGVGIGAVSAAAQREPVVFDGITSSKTYYTQPGILEIPGAAPLILTGVVLLGLIWLATIVPNLALAWRRLHDANFPGPFYFLSLIPSIGGLILFVLFLLPSKPEGQRFDLVR